MGISKRAKPRWEARVATGRGTRRAALAAEMAAEAEAGPGETHFARITPMQVRHSQLPELLWLCLIQRRTLMVALK